MTTPPDSSFESTPNGDELAQEIRDALQEGTVEFRPEAQESAVAAALAEHRTVHQDSVVERLPASSKSPWILVAASIVVICVGLVGAVIAFNGGASTMMAGRADTADESTAMADSGNDSAEMDGFFEADDAGGVESSAPTEDFATEADGSAGAMADGSMDVPEASRTEDMNLGDLPEGSVIYDINPTRLINELVDTALARQVGAGRESVSVLDLGLYRDESAFRNHLDSTVRVDIDPGLGERELLAHQFTCLQADLIDINISAATIIGITTIADQDFLVLVHHDSSDQIRIIASPTTCQI